MDSPCMTCNIPPRSRDCETCDRLENWMIEMDKHPKRIIKELVNVIIDSIPKLFLEDIEPLLFRARLYYNSDE